MRSSTFRRLSAIALAFGVAGVTHAGPQLAQRVPNAGPIKPVTLPLGAGKGAVTLVLELAGDPVAVQQANAGRKLTKAEKDAIKVQLKGPQAQLKGSIAALGGQVLGEYQVSYNGIKVRIGRDKTA